MANPISDIIGGIAGLTSGGSYGPRQSVRLAAQGTLGGYGQTLPARIDMDALTRAYQLQQGSNDLNTLLFGSSPAMYSITHDVKSRPIVAPNSNYTASGTPGLLEIIGQLSPQLQGLYQSGAQTGIAGNMDLLNRYLPEAQAFNDAANPELAGLRTGLGQRANQNLALGSRINPQDAWRITQGVRGDWANRGLGGSLPAGLAEAMQLYGGGEALRSQRTQEAGNIFNLLSSSQPDYARFILGLGGNPTGDALGLIGGQQGLAYQPLGYDPYNSAAVSSSIAGGRDQMYQNQMKANSAGAIGGGIFDLAGGAYNAGLFGTPTSAGKSFFG